MSIATITTKLAEARAALATAKAKSDANRDLAAASALHSDYAGAAALVAALKSDLAVAEREAELERLAAARASRLEAITAEQAQRRKSLKAINADALVAAIEAAHAAVDQIHAAGIHLDLPLPQAKNLPHLRVEVINRARAAEASIRDTEAVESEAEADCWHHLAEARRHADGARVDSVRSRALLSNVPSLPVDDETLIRSHINWSRHPHGAARALFLLLVEGWTLKSADEVAA